MQTASTSGVRRREYTEYVTVPALERLIPGRSDALAGYREFDHPVFRQAVGPLDHFVLIIDTNRVLEEIGWLVAKRKRPDARTGLQELHASGTVSLFAPEILIDEVESHLQEIADYYRTSVDALRAAWAEYREMIHFIPDAHLGPADPSARDPKDVPFVRAKEAVGAAAIISKDNDIRAMAGLIVAHETIRLAVDYARAATTSAEGRMMVLTAVGSVCGVVWGIGAGTVAAVRGYLKLPPWLKIAVPIAVLLSLLAVALHPTPRRKLRDAVDALKSKWPGFKAEAGALVEQFGSELRSAETNARNALEIVRQQIPSSKKGPTLRQYAYRACLGAGLPLPLAELESEIRRMGYETESRQLGSYLRRVLRSDSRFREASGRWDLSARVRGQGVIVDVTLDQAQAPTAV